MPKRKGEAGRDELAAIFGCDVRTISNYVNQHTDFPSRVEGKFRYFPVVRCVRWKIDHEVADAVTSMKPPELTGIADAEKRKMFADAELAELKVQRLRGDLIPVADAAKEIEKAFARVRGRFGSVPGEYAPRMLHLESLPDAIVLMREMVSTVLSELQQGLVYDEDEVEPDPAGDSGESPE